MTIQRLLPLAALFLASPGLRAEAPATVAEMVYYENATSNGSNGIPDRLIRKIILRSDGSATTLYWRGGDREYLYAPGSDGQFRYTKTGQDTGRLEILGAVRTLTFGASGTAGDWSDGLMHGVFTMAPLSVRAPLLNASQRAPLTAGRPTIAGIVLGESRDVVIRVVGPGLQSFGASGAPNPKLTVYSGNTVVAENLDWEAQHPSFGPPKESLVRMFNLCGAFALADGSKDAAIMLPLAKGNYTVQASIENQSGEGEVLIEVYILP